MKKGDAYLYYLLLKCKGSVSFTPSGHKRKEGSYQAFRIVGFAKTNNMDVRGQNASSATNNKTFSASNSELLSAYRHPCPKTTGMMT